MGCCLLTDLKAVSKENEDILNDTPSSSPSLQAEMMMSWVGHFSFVIPHNFHRKSYLMLHNLAGATIHQVANLPSSREWQIHTL